VRRANYRCRLHSVGGIVRILASGYGVSCMALDTWAPPRNRGVVLAKYLGAALLFPFPPLSLTSVREYVFYVFSDFKKTWLFTFFEMTFQKKRKSHKKYQVCWMSIEILASNLPDVMGTYRRLSHTVLSCIVSCVHTTEQDVWCWWPWLTGTDFR